MQCIQVSDNNAISEVNKGDCITMGGGFNHWNIQRDTPTTEHSGRRPNVYVPNIGRFPDPTFNRTSLCSAGIRFSAAVITNCIDFSYQIKISQNRS